ncbi:hypothetical protein BDY17DRAFT_325837 [Neohortaea acidophila]|uniref:F-box domain-containing protein n=1 Tax=Neohortaea acidophila TaxID=245834 RepID=A0A6A6PM50_9PEZI|nr:uncharacterized protein BDY17DRAFT_325837 [Neohortaea acidophila]KAF2481119.1 hypothetical protein BDY17DRAFT_325837 [Neohortaea acidophila]
MDALDLAMQISKSNRDKNLRLTPEKPTVNVISNYPLLDLPPEIWSKICRYAAVPSGPSAIFVPSLADRDYWQQQLTQPGITRTCRAIRAECLGTFYQNLYVIYDETWTFPIIGDWLYGIGAANRKRVVIHEGGGSSYWSGNDAIFERSHGRNHGGIRGQKYGHYLATLMDDLEEFSSERHYQLRDVYKDEDSTEEEDDSEDWPEEDDSEDWSDEG